MQTGSFSTWHHNHRKPHWGNREHGGVMLKKWHSSTTLSSTDLRPLTVLSKIGLSWWQSIPYLTCMKEGWSRPRWAEYTIGMWWVFYFLIYWSSLTILLIQWKAVYTAIAEYKTLASGRTWDNEKGADIDDKDPATKAFWEGYTKSPVSSFNIYIIIITNYIQSSSKRI